MNRLVPALLALFTLIAQPVAANWCAIPARDGTVTISGVVNTYFPGTQSVAAGATSIKLGTATGASTAIAAGDLLLVIQMQDAQISTSNSDSYGSGTAGGYGNGYTAIGKSGRYEFVRATNSVPLSGGTLTIQGAAGTGLTNAYTQVASSETGYRKSFQIVRVPQYLDATISGLVTATPWDGSSGGIVALDVARRLTFAGGAISVTGQGFRGGGARSLGSGDGLPTDYATGTWTSANGSKGEGVAGTPRLVMVNDALVEIQYEGIPGGAYARGAPGNAGGGATDGYPPFNLENAGGGGGGNGGQGGRGGNAWCSGIEEGCNNDPDHPWQSGGHPGARVVEEGVARLIMGGGGGAGTSNDGTGVPSGGVASSGATGGGIVFLRAGEVAGTGSVSANGADANNTVENDGSGGGGAGGTVLIAALRQIAGLSISVSARGGNGGSNTGGGSAHGPGGGGGGGFVASSIPVSASLTGGSAGTTLNAPAVWGPNYGASGGDSGAAITISGADVPGVSSGGECTPTLIKSFDRASTSPGVPTLLQVQVVNNNPTRALNSVGFTDTYPAGLYNTSAPAPADSCAAASTLTAAAEGGSFTVSSGVVPAGGSCTYSVNTKVTAHGASKTNVIATGALTGSYGLPELAKTLADSSAVLSIDPPLMLTKESAALSDPKNGTTDPKMIPGALVGYTFTVSNPATYSVSSGSIALIETTPSNLRMFVSALPGETAPMLFVDGTPSSGLTFTFDGLDSVTDDVDFSNDGGATWTYTPVPDGSGADPAVTNVRYIPKGSMAPGSSFRLKIGYIIK